MKVDIGPPRNLALAEADDLGDDCPDSATLSDGTTSTNRPKLSANLIIIRFMQLLSYFMKNRIWPSVPPGMPTNSPVVGTVLELLTGEPAGPVIGWKVAL